MTLKYATVDFEAEPIGAISFIFPDVKIIGCLFHFKQAFWRIIWD